DHVQKLFRFTDAVVFSFDGDSAGRRAARKALDAALPFATDVRSVKFLFLPEEHDPDSFIRAHGKEGFAAYVAKAVPLSKFMLEAAAEGCELDSAEGRAHMASNARPLWSLLPDGTLKRQLLAEIADQVQIDSRELLQIWQPAHANSYKNNSGSRTPDKGYRHRSSETSGAGPGLEEFSGNFADLHDEGAYAASLPALTGPASSSRSRPVRRIAGRVLPASREDRVLRLMLTDPQSWDKLSGEEHALLCELPAPHGPLFVWLESQLHEHGPQPWAALREGLREHPQEKHAIDQIAQLPEGIECDWNEVRSILDQLLKLKRQQEMVDLLPSVMADPAARQRYEALAALLKKS
ncbi:MAG: DNA primase, partial [Polaromonas sp.]|nr:DNA primase [Polaromonas sp.]